MVGRHRGSVGIGCDASGNGCAWDDVVRIWERDRNGCERCETVAEFSGGEQNERGSRGGKMRPLGYWHP